MQNDLPADLIQQEIDVISSHVKEGRLSAQVPHIHIDLGAAVEGRQPEDIESVIDRLFEKGLVAWKCATQKPGRPEVLYTRQPLNPNTQRELAAYLWMTPLALDVYGDALFKAWTENTTRQKDPLTRSQWDEEMRTLVVAAAPEFAHMTDGPLVKKKAIKPKANMALNSHGEATRLGPVNSRMFTGYSDVRGDEFLRIVEKWNVGPTTLLTLEHHGRGQAQEARWFERAVISNAGADGIRWLTRKQFPVGGEAYFYVAAYGFPHEATAQTIAAWDLLVEMGVEPPRELWLDLHNKEWNKELVEWLRDNDVDWSVESPRGETPLGLVLRACNNNTVDFFKDKNLFDGQSMLDMLSSMGGMIPAEFTQTMDQEMQEEEAHLEDLQNLAIDMMRSGQDPFVAHGDSGAAISNLLPEQLHMERAIVKQLGGDAGSLHEGEDVDGIVANTLLFGEHDKMLGARSAYGPKMIEFIERIEKECDRKILHDEPIPVKRPRI